VGKHTAPRPSLTELTLGLLPDAKVAGAVGAVVAAPLAVVAGAGAASAVTPYLVPDVAQAAPAGAPFAAPQSWELLALRGCESGGNYAINTGNGYYGAYQFDFGTWRSLGYAGAPNAASPAVQDAAVSALEEQRGWTPWPSCSARIGLVPRRAGTTTATPAGTRSHVKVSAPSSVGVHTAPASSGAAPSFAGGVVTTAQAGTYRSDVRLWQGRMAARGWPIAVDGHYGPQSAMVAAAFATEKHLAVALPGELDGTLWKASWALPVT